MRALVLVLLVATGFPAFGAVESAAPGGFRVRNTIEVPVEPEMAWSALVAEVDRWWPRDHTWWGEASTLSIEAKAGGCFCEVAGARQAEHMRVAFVDPPKLLRMTGGLGPLQGMGLHGALEWQIDAIDGGSRITLTYQVGGYSPQDLTAFAPIVDQVQALQLGVLGTFLTPPAEKQP